MRRGLGILFVWAVGLRDLLLSVNLIGTDGLDGELNPIARLAVELGGLKALFTLKIASLIIFSLAEHHIHRANRRTAE